MSCTTIRLKETDAFDIKRTISPDFFINSQYNIEELQFPSADGLRLNGWFIKNKLSPMTVLYFGGNGFVMVTSFHIINSIIDQNVNLLVFDYRGYGENPGKPTVSGLKEDGLAAYKFLIHEKRIDPQKLIIHGHFLGSFIASYVASKREAAGLILECPITDAEDWTGRLLPWFLKPFVKFDIDPALQEDSNLKRMGTNEIPLLIFAGKNDKITPPGMAKKLFEEAKTKDKQLVLIDNGGHNDLPEKDEYKKTLYNFFMKLDNSVDK